MGVKVRILFNSSELFEKWAGGIAATLILLKDMASLLLD